METYNDNNNKCHWRKENCKIGKKGGKLKKTIKKVNCDGNLQKTVSSISCFISAPLFGRAGCSTTQLKKRLSYIFSKFLVPVKIDLCINDDFWKVLCLFAIVDDHLAFLIAAQTIQIFATTLLTFAKIIVIIVEQIVICAKC